MVHSSSRSRQFFRLLVVRLVADVVVTIALAAAAVAWYALTVRWLERRPATEAVPDWRLCGLGALIGFGLFCSIYGIFALASAPDSVIGGAFGPEASVIAVAVCFGMTLVFAIAAIRSRRWRALSFRLVLD